jgi:hypothetical protein
MSDNRPYPQLSVTPVKGLSSEQGAALFLSNGETADPNEAVMMANDHQTFDMDAMTRAALRRKMGFDFKVKVRGSKVMVSSKDGPKVRTSCRIKPGEVDDNGNIVSEELIGRLVDACLRLKTKWEEASE